MIEKYKCGCEKEMKERKGKTYILGHGFKNKKHNEKTKQLWKKTRTGMKYNKKGITTNIKNFCICGCNKEISFKLYHTYYKPKFIQGHNSVGLNKENSEKYRKVSEKLKGRTKENDESKKIMSEKLSKFLIRKDITKEKILEVTKNIIKYENNLSRIKIWHLLKENLKCKSKIPIIRAMNSSSASLDIILNELNIDIPKWYNWKQTEKWRKKEELGLELCMEIYGKGDIKKYYKNIGYPDYVPENTSHPLIEIKSNLNIYNIKQKEKYEHIRKDVRFMVFEDKGYTNTSNVLYMKEIIRTLPNNKRIVFQQKYERIINNIPLEQIELDKINEELND